MAYDTIGADITDEAVACTSSVTIDMTTYYRGRLAEYPSGSVFGITSGTYGAWSAVSKGGTRFRVDYSSGVPTDSNTGTGSPPDLVLDAATGYVLSTVSQTVYFRYRGHGAIDLTGSATGSEARAITLPLYGILESGTTRDFIDYRPEDDIRITKYQIVAPAQGGVPPSSNITLSLRDDTGGGGSAATDTLDMTAGNNTTGWVTLSTPFEIASSAKVVVRGDGKNAANLIVYLWHEPA